MRQSRLAIISMMICCLLAQTFPVSAINSWPENTDGSVPSNGNGSLTAKEHWARFRQAFPFHIQTLAFHEESRTLIISEPPPHVTLVNVKEALQRYNPTLAPTMSVETTRVGVDGWVKDILLQLPQMNKAATNDALDAIQQHVFHTTYKAYVMSLPVEKPVVNSDKLDLKVSVTEIKKWLFEDNEPLLSLYGGDEQTANQLLTSKTEGVFFSKGRGLVIWSIIRTKPISDALIEARQFALDSDIIVGSVNVGDQIFIVGRERIVPVNILPPLRSETIMLLASVGDAELHQSYERMHIFAGFFNETQDWAPIYLSDALIDTEYGSLLNITDQILKRWSDNGLVKYANFDYPDPPKWCFNGSLFEEVGSDQVTYNWNTKGVGYTAEVGGREFFALNRTGSLPTSYFAGEADQTGFTKLEEKGYQCFATWGDPNLARVVQYAALYQIFQKFPVKKDDKFVKTPLQPHRDVLTEKTKTILTRLNADNHLAPLLTRLNADNYLAFLLGSGTLNTLNEERINALAKALAHPRLNLKEQTQLQRTASQLNRLRNNLVLYFRALERLPREQQTRLWAIITARSILANPSLKVVILGVGRIAKDDIKNEYVTASKRNDSEWIRTPSVVVSQGLERFVGAIGGHNLSASVTVYKANPVIQRGKVRIRKVNGRTVVEFNPSDLGRISTLVRRTAALTDSERLTPLQIQQRLEAGMGGAPPPIQPMKAALGQPDLPPPGRGFNSLPPPGHAPGSGGGNGWRPGSILVGDVPEEARTAARYGDVAVLVDRQPTVEGFEYTITTLDGKVLKAYSTPSAIDAIVNLGKSAAKDNPKIAFHLKNFTEGEALGFLYNADLRLKNNSLAGFVQRQVNGVNPLSHRTKAVDYNLPGVNVEQHSFRQVPEGQFKGLFELKLNFDVPARDVARPPLKVGLQMLYRNAISDPTIAGVKRAIRTFFSKPVAADSNMNNVVVDLANELRSINPDAKNILTIWEEDTSGVIIVELRRLQRNDGHLQEKSGAE